MKTKTNLFALSILLGVIFCLSTASPAWPTVFYVDAANGSDSNDGLSSGTAWGTLHYAVSQLNTQNTAGHVLNVAQGMYSTANAVNAEADAELTVTRSGVTIQGATDVVIDGSGSCVNNIWDIGITIDASDVDLKNLVIQRFGCDGSPAVRIQSGPNVRIEACDVNSSDTGIYFASGSGSGNAVLDCKIHLNNLTGVDIDGAEPEILRNIIYDNGTGITVNGSSGTIRPKIVNNLIYNTGASGPGSGIEIYAYSTGATVAAEVYHNTLVGSGQVASKGIYASEENPVTTESLDVKYNIVTGFEIGIQDAFATSGILVFDYNDVVNNTTDYNNASIGTYDVSIEPMFVDGGNFDFHLGSTSPLLNLIKTGAGDTVAEDREGVVRPKGLGREMGCYEISDTQALWVYNVGSSYRNVILPDINDDGFDELVVHANPTGDNISSYVYVISGADGATILWTYTLDSYQRGLAVLDDLDGDGIQDILVMIGTSDRDYNFGDDAMYVLSGAVAPPAGRLIWGPIGHDGTDTGLGCGLYQPVIVPDINNDGINDIFANVSVRGSCYNSDAGLLFSGADGSRLWFFTQTTTPSGLWDIYGSTATPDLNGDTLADVIVSGATAADSGGVHAWRGGGTEAVLIWNALLGENITSPAVVGDLNSDGVADIGVGKFHTTCPEIPDPRLYVLSGIDGAVLWDYGLQNTPRSIGNLGDVTGDGIADVVIGTALTNTCGGSDSSVYALDGDPGASTRVIWTYSLTGQNSYVKVVPDTNGDGKKDVIVTGQHDKLLLLSGVNGSVLAQESFPNGSGSGTVQTGEFNNAAGNDILTSVGNSIYALSFEPTGTYQNHPPATPVLVYPANEAVISTIDAESLTLQASAFSDPDGDAHGKSYWEVKRSDSGDLLPSYDPPSETGLTQHMVFDTLDPGLKYAWRVKYEDENGAASGWSTMSTFKVGNSVRTPLPPVKAGTAQADYGMISIVHWPNDPSPAKVFNIKYDPRYYKIGTYDPVNSQYIEFGGNLIIEPGRSYWMLAREGITVNFDGIPVSTAVSIDVCLHHNGSTTSPDGWNMIAPPNDANYPWGEVLVGRWLEDYPELMIAPVAISSGSPDIDVMIDPTIWEWQAGAYVAHQDENFLLERYKGYWVEAKVEGVYLVFPDYAQTTLSQTASAVAASSAREAATEDGDGPPMPMGALNENTTENIFGGCFIEIASDFN